MTFFEFLKNLCVCFVLSIEMLILKVKLLILQGIRKLFEAKSSSSQEKNNPKNDRDIENYL